MGARGPVKIAGAVALVAASALGFAAPATGDPGSDAKAKIAAAQKAADEAAARYEDAQVRLANLSEEMTRLQQQIDAGEEESAALRVLVDRRAVTAYKQTGSGVEFFTTADDPLDSARRQKLLDQAGARDNAAVSRLARVHDDLEQRRKDMDARRSEQQALLDRFREEASRLEADLVAARKAQAAAEAAGQNAATPAPPASVGAHLPRSRATDVRRLLERAPAGRSPARGRRPHGAAGHAQRGRRLRDGSR